MKKRVNGPLNHFFCFTEYYKCPAHRTDRLLYTEAPAKTLELKKKKKGKQP